MDQEVADKVDDEEFDHQHTVNIDFAEQTIHVQMRGEAESLPALPQGIPCFPNGREWTYKLDCF